MAITWKKILFCFLMLEMGQQIRQTILYFAYFKIKQFNLSDKFLKNSSYISMTKIKPFELHSRPIDNAVFAHNSLQSTSTNLLTVSS